MSVSNFELIFDKTRAQAKSELKQVAMGNNGDYVIVLHGYLRSYKSMQKICQFLDKKNFIVFNCDYRSTKYSIDIIANELLKKFITRFCTKKYKTIHFIGHSMGAVIIRKFLQDNPMLNLGKVVMISPPNHGSYIADILTKIPFSDYVFGPSLKQLSTTKNSFVNRLPNIKCDCGIITAQYDWVVSQNSTMLVGADDYTEISATHYGILSNKRLPGLIYNFLSSSCFE